MDDLLEDLPTETVESAAQDLAEDEPEDDYTEEWPAREATQATFVCREISGAVISTAYGVDHLGPATYEHAMETPYEQVCDRDLEQPWQVHGPHRWELPAGSWENFFPYPVADHPSGLGSVSLSLGDFSWDYGLSIGNYSASFTSPNAILGDFRSHRIETSWKPENATDLEIGLGGFCIDHHTCMVVANEDTWFEVSHSGDNNAEVQSALVVLAEQIQQMVDANSAGARR